jgi:predicted O-methyltransferase YrrM
LRDRRAYYKLLLQGKVMMGSTPFEQHFVVNLASGDFTTYDYISPNLATISLDYAFPKMIEVDRNFSYWKYLNKSHKNKFYADATMPAAGFINRDEVHLLYNLALLGQGEPALEIGCWMGWSAAHIAAAGVSELHIVDPNLSSTPWQESVRDSLTQVGVLDRCVFHTGYSPEALHLLPQKPWRIIFIDGNHDGEGPLADAVVVSSLVAASALILFHDLLSPDVAKGLRYLKNTGWQTGIYLTAQVMGVAWRGDISPIAHQYDRNNTCMLPAHLDEFPILSC